MSAAAARLTGLVRRFGDTVAVRDVSLTIPRGRISGILGPNGSGKTSTLRMMLGILSPDAGEVELLGGPPDESRRQRVGYMPEHRSLGSGWTTREAIAHYATLRGMRRREALDRTDAWLARFELSASAKTKVKDLSRGMAQKAQFISTVLHEPELLILDEPFGGLDPMNQEIMRAAIDERLAAGAGVLLSTHQLGAVESVLQDVNVLVGGRVVLQGELAELKRASRTGVLEIEHDGDDAWLQRPEVARVEAVGPRRRVALTDGADAQDLLRAAVQAGVRIRHWAEVEPTLHELVVAQIVAARLLEAA